MAVVNNESVPFYQAIHQKKRFRLGTIKRDAVGNDYVYVAGVASLAAGDFCTYDSTFTLSRLLSTGAGGSVAVAMSANTAATTFGWALVRGMSPATANIATNASGIGLGLCASATAGRATTSPAAGKSLFGSVAMSNPASNQGVASLNFASFQNQSTL